jgi:hypothetical protein
MLNLVYHGRISDTPTRKRASESAELHRPKKHIERTAAKVGREKESEGEEKRKKIQGMTVEYWKSRRRDKLDVD